MLQKKIEDAIKMFEDNDVNEVTIDVKDVIVTVTRKSFFNAENNVQEDVIIRSPMVGVISLLNNEKKPLISKSNSVKKDDVLCIIESLKIQHEIQSKCNGVVKEIYVNDKELVEYNQPLFRIKP